MNISIYLTNINPKFLVLLLSFVLHPGHRMLKHNILLGMFGSVTKQGYERRFQVVFAK